MNNLQLQCSRRCSDFYQTFGQVNKFSLPVRTKIYQTEYKEQKQISFKKHTKTNNHFIIIFIRPSSDGTYYGMVMSVRPSGSPSVRLSVRHSFPHFSPTCFDILIWNFVYHFIFMHVRSSSNAINFRHFLQELCSFLTSNSYKYAVFRTFLLHALTYWVKILYMTLF